MVSFCTCRRFDRVLNLPRFWVRWRDFGWFSSPNKLKPCIVDPWLIEMFFSLNKKLRIRRNLHFWNARSIYRYFPVSIIRPWSLIFSWTKSHFFYLQQIWPKISIVPGCNQTKKCKNQVVEWRYNKIYPTSTWLPKLGGP